MHSLLRRQLIRFFGYPEAVPEELSSFLGAVEDAYQQFDGDRAMLERSLELSSNELLQANADMRAIFEVLPDLFFRIDGEGIILDCRAGKATDILIPPKTLIGKRIQDIPIAGVGRKFSEAIQLVSEHRAMTSFEYALESDGQLRHYESRLLPLQESEIITIIRDITESKLDEERKARLTAAVEQAVEAIIITDAEGVIQYVNPALEAITGYSRDEVVGQKPNLFRSGRHDTKFYQGLWDTLRRGGVWQGRFVNKRKDGSLVELEASISPVLDADRSIINYVALERDETEMLQLEAQLRQAQKLEAVGSLAAGIAHEINTPIQYVGDNVRFMSEAFNGVLQLLSKGVSSCPKCDHPIPLRILCSIVSPEIDIDFLSEEVPRAVDETLQGIERVATIVRAMKDFSHPDEREKVPTDINKALLTTLTVAHNELKYVAHVRTALDEELPLVACCPGSLNQVFLNLLVNAAHAIADVVGEGAAEKGWITVTTKRSDNYAIIEVNDTGTGIKKEIRDRIFDSFFTTKEVGKGTGQGLAIARSVIVDQHGGSITFDSEEGKGTTFRVTLPLITDTVPVS